MSTDTITVKGHRSWSGVALFDLTDLHGTVMNRTWSEACHWFAARGYGHGIPFLHKAMDEGKVTVP